MKAGEDFYLAYSSERIAEGHAFDEFSNMPTVVGAVNSASLKRAVDLLSIICKSEIIEAGGIKEVETAKVFENVQRDVNIAMSQEFARFTEALGIDIFEVIKLANTHKRVNLMTPGPGVGGYCIPNAYHYIAPKAEDLGVSMDLLKLARAQNTMLPEFIVDKTEELLLSECKKLGESKVAVLGLAMKDYSNDDRNSPPIDICNLLLKRGADVIAYDPAVMTEHAFMSHTQEEALQGADVVLILAKQHGIHFDNILSMVQLMNKQPICIDTKAAISKASAEQHGL
jgi:UDP-N-acetyl-D-mannosaminuronate dehydrogenase